jgi:ABC-type lipoprotein release transport system permease subunit
VRLEDWNEHGSTFEAAVTPALGAALLPAWRATRIAPMEALRQD